MRRIPARATVRNDYTTGAPVSDDRRCEINDSDEVVENELAESSDATITEGEERLNRPWRIVLIAGFFGGLEVGLGSRHISRCCISRRITSSWAWRSAPG